MAQERRPVPFRTRKLRPGTAMVLHPTGCGRVARRRTTRTGSPDTPQRYRGFPHIRTLARGGCISRPWPRPEPARAPGPPRIPMRPTPGTIPGQPRRRGRTARRVRDRGSPTPGPPVRRADSSPPEGSQKLAWLWGRSTLASAMHYFTPKRCATSNKIMYHDKAQAQRAADQSLIERGAELWVYRCEYCGCWHLTHRDPQSSYRHVPLNQQLKPHSRKKGYKPRRR